MTEKSEQTVKVSVTLADWDHVLMIEKTFTVKIGYTCGASTITIVESADETQVHEYVTFQDEIQAEFDISYQDNSIDDCNLGVDWLQLLNTSSSDAQQEIDTEVFTAV